MEIKELKIKNFRGIYDMEFCPKKFNVIVGRNNTGKTSILEAVNILADPHKLKFHCYNDCKYVQNIMHALSEFSEITATNNNNKKEKIKISYAEGAEIINDFKKNLIKALGDVLMEYSESRHGKTLKKEIAEEIENKIDEIINFGSIMQIVKENKKGFIKVVKNAKKEIFYDPSIFAKAIIKATNIKKFEELENEMESKYNLRFAKGKRIKTKLREIASEIGWGIGENKYFHNIHKNRSHSIMIKCGSGDFETIELTAIEEVSEKERKEKKEKLQKIEEIIKEHELIENLDRLDFDYVSYKYPDKERIYIPFSSLGDGSKVMIYILWNLVSTSATEIKDKIVLLDEPETSMHPGYIIELLGILIKLSREQNIQFFISTHSGDFIDMILDEENFSKEEQKYLKKEFLLLRMDKLDEMTVANDYDYKEAKEAKEEFLLDLRGI